MRADRLISILLLLQTRSNISARQLAAELEVSERTIYRDIEALSQAGIPVYTLRGPGGGVFLVENYRTSLTGLTGEQLQALFMLNIPKPLVQLGAGDALKTALLKLSAASSVTFAQEEDRARQRFYLDWESEPSGEKPVPFLEILRQGVWQDRLVRLRYKPHFFAEIEQTVEPLGLIARGTAWYLACIHGDHRRAISVDTILEAQLLGDHFARPEDFNLVEFWQGWLVRTETDHPVFPVKVRVSPGLFKELPRWLGEQARPAMQHAALPDERGWRTLDLNFDTLETARSRLLAMGGAVEILEPEALRLSLVDYARQVAEIYREKDA